MVRMGSIGPSQTPQFSVINKGYEDLGKGVVGNIKKGQVVFNFVILTHCEGGSR
jgi:hypothetical protein